MVKLRGVMQLEAAVMIASHHRFSMEAFLWSDWSEGKSP